MRYFFHLESETSISLDHRGREFQEPRSVAEHAAAMARGLAGDEAWAGWSVRVIDSNNREVFRVPIGEAALSK